MSDRAPNQFSGNMWWNSYKYFMLGLATELLKGKQSTFFERLAKVLVGQALDCLAGMEMIVLRILMLSIRRGLGR